MTKPTEKEMWLMALQQAVGQLVCLGVDHEAIEEAVDRAMTRGREQVEALRSVFNLEEDA
jgi:hypothetical protein